MTHKMKRLVSFFLTFAMLLSLIPMQVFATGSDQNGENLPANVRNIQVFSDSQAQPRPDNYFADVDELIELLKDKTSRNLYYDGPNPFSVEKNVEVPSRVNLDFNGMDVVVEEDVEMIVEGHMYCGDLQVLGELSVAKKLNCQNLDVEGIMNAENRFSAEESVNVSGTLNADYGFHIGNEFGSELVISGLVNIPENGIQMRYPAAVTRGTLDKIKFNPKYDGQKVHIEALFEDMDELTDYVTVLSNANGYIEHQRINYSLYNPWDEDRFGNETFEFKEDLEIPSHISVEFNTVKSVTIAEDVTITNHGEFMVFAPLIIKGEFVNNGMLNVNNQRETDDNSEFNGKVTVTKTGEYSGDGEFQIHVDQNIFGLDQVLFGFDLDEMRFRSNTSSDDNMTHYWLIHGDDEGPMNSYGFNTFDELVDLADQYAGSSVNLWYNGDETLVIERDLELPADVQLDLQGYGLEIPSGVTFKTNEWVYCEDLTVAGTLEANERIHANGAVQISGKMIAQRALHAGEGLKVTGVLDVKQDRIHMNYQAPIDGIDKILFAEDWQGIVQEAPFADMDELEARMNALAQNYIDHDRVSYTVWLPWDVSQGMSEFEITKDIVVPAHVELQLTNEDTTYVIADGVKVTNNGKIWINTDLEIEGSLVNNNEVSVSHEGDNKGTITVSNTGAMIGKGEFWIGGDRNTNDWTDVVSVSDPDDYDVRMHQNPDGNVNWTLTYAKNKKKLGTPINLEWGVEYREQWDWDEQNQMGVIIGWDEFLKPGFISWETVTPDQARAQIKIYRVGDSAPTFVGEWGFDPQRQPQFRTTDDFLRNDEEFADGTYYFTVQSLADSIEYRNSDVADSRDYGAVYTYVSASNKLPVPSGLEWDDRDDEFFRWADWNDRADSQYLDGYWVLFYYSPTKDGPYEQYGGSSSRWDPVSESPFDTHFIQEKGIGYYKFKVKALSNDIEKMSNSDWSAFSPVLDVKEISGKVSSGLQDIIDANQGNVQPADILKDVQRMDTQELQAALAADTHNLFATKNLAQLEQMAAGGPAAVQVTADASAFNVQDVSIVGANLNNKADNATAPITLVVDKPEQNHVIPERYNSSVAVRFSMNLENVANQKKLDVPVKITLPVPDSINPDFLVILHYYADGGHELIRPHVYWENNKCYADFVLTRFSDFVMTEMPQYEEDDDDDEDNYSAPIAVVEDPLPEYVVSGQWTVADGKWTFADSTGTAYANKWAAVVNPYANKELGQSAFDWFFFDANGHMMTGWVQDGGRWYYLNPVSDGTQGRMMTGWVLIDGKWYYLNPVSDGTKGAMIVNTWIDKYYVDENGVWDESKTK